MAGELLDPVKTTTEPTSAAWFRPALLAIAFLGVVVRVGSSLSVRSDRLGIDAPYYHETAANIASGRGYVAPVFGSAKLVPTALHPPFFPMVLAAFDLLGLGSVAAQRIALAVLASSAVAAMGLLGRKVAGPAVGITAAAIAAVDPLWLQPIGSLMSETILFVIIPVVLLSALLCIEDPSPWRFAALGFTVALAALTRSETVAFILLLGVPVVLFAAAPWRRRVVLGTALTAGFVLLMGPWLVRNELQLGGLTLSDNGGVTLVGAYSPNAFDPKSSSYGSFDGVEALAVTAVTRISKPPHHAGAWTELALNNTLTADARQFALAHLSDIPGVVLAREGRIWGLYHPGQVLAAAQSEVGGERSRTLDQLGQIFYWIMLPFVIVGLAALMKRSPQRFIIIAMPIVVVALNAGFVFGSMRLRVTAEPSLAVFAAMGLLAVATWIRRWPLFSFQRSPAK
ncbi:MAG TPA: hypothetical protein VG032_10635 [Acidimicrobiales bacterium]|nr:hypothetical protein [Acidimicrobiales bacterium]